MFIIFFLKKACIHPSNNHLLAVVCLNKAKALGKYHQYFAFPIKRIQTYWTNIVPKPTSSFLSSKWHG
jgi:hypothetical protein